MNEFSPFETLQRLFRNWWLIAACGILGGLLGWLSTRLLPTVYEATAVLVVRVDEMQLTNDLRQEYLTPADKEGVLKPVVNLILSTDILNEVVGVARLQSIDLGFQEARRDFNLHRINTNWMLMVRHHDPRTASLLANLWTETAEQAVQEAYQHAVAVYNLELGYHAVSLCFSNRDFQAANECAGTDFANMDGLVTFQQSVAEQIEAENAKALGLDHTLRFEFATPADIPVEPVRYQAGMLIFAGMGIGLVIGFIVAQIRPRIR